MKATRKHLEEESRGFRPVSQILAQQRKHLEEEIHTCLASNSTMKFHL